ncbi:uncharacterized protein LOC135201844 [Macrobrachium nipponense]|uniref:uncharacterized protein LOC135201844 n=1 Tax=Macrobrachium nipponense TaxID=159736 RepID=UPI0030C7E57D
MIEEEEEAQPPVPRLLSATSLAHAVALIEQGLAIIEAQDPNLERYSSFQRKVQDAMTFYKETVKEKQMVKSIQSTLEVYGFKKRSPVPPLTLDGDVVTTPDPTETVVPVVSPAASPGSSFDLQKDKSSLDDPPASPPLSELPDLLPYVDPPASPTLPSQNEPIVPASPTV